MRLVFGVQYLGTNYSGWQKQPNTKTVQGLLEEAFSKVANEKISLIGSGRTDAGVHASGQIGHFDTQVYRPYNSWIRGTNRFLPEDINITFVKNVDTSFHSRFSAVKREYRYLIYNHEVRSSCWSQFSSQEFLYLDANNMNEAAKLLIGKHDFTSLRHKECQSFSPVRNIHSANVVRKGDFIIFSIVANSFLHHMVRNIMGVLVPIGLGDKPIEWVKDVINLRKRSESGVTYSPKGLYLHKVDYGELFSFNLYRQKYIIDIFNEI